EYISLESMKDVTFFFDEKNLSLQIALPPGLLPKKAIDLLPERRSKVYYPSDDSAFLNYRLNYYSVGDYNQYDLTNQVGVRFKKYYLFLSDSSYTMTDTEDRFTRLMTNITYDDRKVLKRTVYGDFLASSGELGSSVNMGGFSYSKAYQLDPYYVKYPMMNISGLVPLPSEIEIYIDGMLARKEKLSPGQFELNNIYSYRGAGAATIVIKDAFGRTETISYPFYFTDILLKKGLHEYSYNIGLLREDFGVESNAYGDFAFSAFHRHGFTDSLTLGVRSEATNGLYNLGPEGSYRIRNAGTISMSLAGSAGEKTGIAGSLSYIYQEKRLNAGMFTKWYSEEYANIGTLSLTERVRSEVGAVVGYGRKDFGSASLEYATTKKYDGLDRKVITATYSKSLSNKLTVFMNLRNIREEKDVNEVFVGLNYYIWDNASLSASHRSTESEDIDMLQMQKNTPLGEGIGYLVSAERSDSDSGSDTSLQAAMQYNTRNAVYEGEFRSGDGEEGSYRLSASGALVYLNNVFGIIRPINDSFGLVQTGSLEGVR
ncbi:MAG TPA: fimbria/pilus outer membrane usher protein, partial [Syntrophales bacterium]|nr:fimbria/pilus outer membrane usher protein [Syntrophales bacterium]